MYWRNNRLKRPESRGRFLVTLEILPLTNKGRSDFVVIEAQYEPKNDWWNHDYWKKTSHDTRVVAWMPLPKAFIPIEPREVWNDMSVDRPWKEIVWAKLPDGRVFEAQEMLTPAGYCEWFIYEDGHWHSGVEVVAWKKKEPDYKCSWFDY